MPFTLRDIPAAMRAENWPVGARLMERWLRAPGRQMSQSEKVGDTASPDVETRLVSMAWARGFGRVAQAERALLTTWSSGARLQAATNILTRRVREWRARHGSGNRAFRFGDLGQPTRVVEATAQINIQRIESSLLGDVDDFYAAIGNGLLKIAVSGMVTPLANNRLRIVIDEVGTYMRDTYDFNGDQGLGSWGPTGLRRAALLAPDIQVVAETAKERPGQAFWSVDNESFRKYRAHYGRGGDFLILTDVRRHRLMQPVSLELAA